MSADSSQITAGKPCLPPFPQKEERYLLEDLLRDVSRSFYLTLRVLPKEIRPQISLAYLLARASDTIADCFAIAEAERLDTLKKLRGAFASGSTLDGSRVRSTWVHGVFFRHKQPVNPMDQPVAATWEAQISKAERTLLERLYDCMDLLRHFSYNDQNLVRELLKNIVSGQIFDLEKFPGGDKRAVTALANDDELDRYTYMVAGCVGEFWTKMCKAHLEPLHDWNTAKMCELGIRYGKGLQLVNVLRDVAWDLRRGRCYLPVEHPRSLLDPTNYDSIRAEYTKWLDRAVDHLDAGWEYTMQTPRSLWRLRLACIWPIWIGLKTIARLRTDNPLDPADRIKIPRSEVYGVMGRSFLIVRSDAALNRAFLRLRNAASHR
ncbi:MAG TPA: squalene/phytoene synthase family protein [Verrucomicrobiae bacterium]|nr:squalene/phytoene synthase family protein [Verrucomicrobiae bacterium]